ncbi:hypothetical protein [Rhizobium leguminosarum]|uniref:hypothetical protein n=1 Tax=Rhizobium leguminosarum TaxID=384 RepID=UPI002FF0DB9C
MKMFKLKKAAKAPPTPETGQKEDARRRFEDGLKELREVTTMDAFNRAKASGVEFSIDGFRRRVRIGNQAMRTTHAELFDELKQVLVFIYGEVLRVKRNTRGRSKGPPSMDRQSDAERKVEELGALLDRRERDFLDLLQEMRLLRAQA